MLPQKPRPAHHSPLHSQNASNLDLQLLSEACDYCLSSEHLGAQSSVSTLGNGNKAQKQHQHGKIEDVVAPSNPSHSHIQEPYTTTVKDDNTDSWFKSGIIATSSIDGTAASISSYSSIYSSSEQHLKRPCTVAKSETSARSSIVSQSQESERSISSSMGITSISNESTFSQGHAQQERQRPKYRAGSTSKSQNRSISSFTFGRIKEKERNPLKWLCRRSDNNIQQSDQIMSEQQQADLGQQPRLMKRKEGEEYYHNNVNPPKPPQNQQQIAPQNFGPDLFGKMEKLEEKLETLIVSHSSTSRSTDSPRSSIACQGTPDHTHLHLEGENAKEKGQTPALHSHDNQEGKIEQTSHWEVLETLAAEIDRLIKSNNKLSSRIEALDSSGLIELIEMLSFSIERLNSEVASLRQQQQKSSSRRHSHEDNDDSNLRRQQQINALEIQSNTIKRLGVLLGRSEEQLKHEKRMNSRYNEAILGLEKMVQVLEVEWRKVMPLIYNDSDDYRVTDSSN